MNAFVVLIFTANMVQTIIGRPDSYTHYHKNFTTFTTYHTYTSFSTKGRYTLPEYEDTTTNFQQNFPQVFSRANQARDYTEHIIFPDNHTTQTRSTKNVTGIDCDLDFCKSASDYPEDYIKKLFNQTVEFDTFFNMIVPEITDRINGVEENICASTTEIIYPQAAKNIDDKMRYIANVDKYRQGILKETCNDESPCQFSKDFPLPIKTFCKQRYIQLQLVALDDNQKPIVDVFQAPSCCVCMFKKE